jgi:hypothetical protein
MANSARDLVFADDHISARLVETVRDCEATGIVVNLSSRPIRVAGDPGSIIRPWRSLAVTRGRIEEADRIAVLSVTQTENLGGVSLRGWTWFGDIYSGFPRTTPLYVSAIDTVARVEEDPYAFTGERAVAAGRQSFDLKLKCWWSPGQTDGFIHTEHPFLEVHTQIFGLGRMQKFRTRDAATVYEDVMMAPGFTHEAFCAVAGPSQWKYPWHRYFADEESIWLAVELHPVAGQ